VAVSTTLLQLSISDHVALHVDRRPLREVDMVGQGDRRLGVASLPTFLEGQQRRRRRRCRLGAFARCTAVACNR